MFDYLASLGLAAALASGQASATADQSGPAVRSLSELPNMTILYYDVAGNDVASINRSIVRQRPSVGGRPQAASADWTVNASFRRRTENGRCRVAAVDVAFAGRAELPRLANEQQLKPALLKQWRQYVEGLQANELPTLAFVYSQLDAVKEAVLASSCDQAKATAAAAVDSLRVHATAFELARQKQMRRTESMFADSGLFNSPTAKPICKQLLATGSRLNTLRICMVPREWQLLHEAGQKATREMQDRPLLNRTKL